MAFNKLEDTNALLLYRVGPVLMCSPTLQVESVIVPPAISRASAVSDDEPGMFRSIYGMVRVVDLRVRFGVDVAQRKQPGQIVIVEVVGGHAGFWVDEIEDVIAFPQSGWSQVPSHVPGSVFSRTLLQGNDIRLYAEFDRLDGFKASGYLREHIRNLQQVAQKQETASAETITSAEQSQPHSTSSPDTSVTQVDPLSTTDAESTEHSTEVNTAVQSPLKVTTDAITSHSDDSPPAQTRQTSSEHNESKRTQQRISRPPLTQTTQRQTYHPTQTVDAVPAADRLSLSSANSKMTVAAPTNQLSGAGGDLHTPVPPSATLAEQTRTSWLWWFVPLLLLCVALFMFMQNSQLLQNLTAQNASSALQDRIDLKNDAVDFQAGISAGNEVAENARGAVLSTAPDSIPFDSEAEPAVQIADELTDVISIEADSGDLTITVNEYEEDDSSEYHSTVEFSAQKQMTEQAGLDSKQQSLPQSSSQEDEVQGQYSAQQSQLLSDNETAGPESMPVASVQQMASTQNIEQESEKRSSVKTRASDKVAVQASRRVQHIVVKGDTLWSITGRYINKPWRYPEIARLSNIDNPDLIYPGQRVIIVLNYKNRSD